MSRTAAALLLLVAQIASTNAQEECVGEDSVPGVSLEWDDASVTVNNLGGFGSDGDTNAAQMLKFEDVNYKNGEAQNYFGPTTQVDLEIKTAAFKLELLRREVLLVPLLLRALLALDLLVEAHRRHGVAHLGRSGGEEAMTEWLERGRAAGLRRPR